MQKPLDVANTRIRFGANPCRSAQLSGLFYFVKEHRLLYRSETTTDTKSLPYCASCGEQVSGKSALERSHGRCLHCVVCPHCSSKLRITKLPSDPTHCCFHCHTCSYSSASLASVPCGESEIDDSDALMDIVLKLEKARNADEDFVSLQKHLQAVVTEYTAPQGAPSEEEAAVREREREIGGAAMGMHPERLKVFEASLRGKGERVVVHAPDTTSIADVAVQDSQEAETKEDVTALPVRVRLGVRPAVRYNKQLLVAEIDESAHRRLNRSASILFPRVFVCGALPNTVQQGQTVSLPLSFVNQDTAPVDIESIAVVQTSYAECSVPEGVFTIGAKPEIESHRYTFIEGEGEGDGAGEGVEVEAGVLAQWDNQLCLRLVLKLTELPETHHIRDGVGVTLRIDYKHTIDSVWQFF